MPQKVPSGSASRLRTVNRQNHPQKSRYPLLGGSGHDLPLAEKGKARKHDRRHPTRKKNRREGQSGQFWKAAQGNPFPRGDSTYESAIESCSENRRFRFEIMHGGSMCENHINMMRVEKLKNQRHQKTKSGKNFIPGFANFSPWGTKLDIQNRNSNFRWPASARAPGRDSS